MPKKNILLTVSVVAIFLIGAAVMLYPMVAAEWAKNHQLRVVETYKSAVEETDNDKIEAELHSAEIYNESLLKNSVALTDPFDPDAPDFPDGKYIDMLNLTEVMAYIEIPCINVNLPIYHGSDKDTLEKGVGHLEGTSLPVGGTGTHSCLSAHSGLPTAELFTNLTKLSEGDMFFITALNRKLAYCVDNISVVEPNDIAQLTIDENEDYITLITCTPYAVNTHRLLVRGTRVEYTEEAELEAANTTVKATLTTVEKAQLTALVLGAVLFVVLVVLLLKGGKRKEHRKK